MIQVYRWIAAFGAAIVLGAALFVGTPASATEVPKVDVHVPLENGMIEGVTVTGNKVTIDPAVWTFKVVDDRLELTPKKKKPQAVPVIVCRCSYGPSNCTISVSGGDATCSGNTCCGFDVIIVDLEV